MRLGTNQFLTRCGGISTTLRNRLETLGVIRPERTGSWRTYSERDVAAARHWLQQRGQRRRTR